MLDIGRRIADGRFRRREQEWDHDREFLRYESELPREQREHPRTQTARQAVPLAAWILVTSGFTEPFCILLHILSPRRLHSQPFPPPAPATQIACTSPRPSPPRPNPAPLPYPEGWNRYRGA
ncbi:hypothetical protein OE88DRAFT_363048 [Heliocybe sulcata]|uniref:Uncharacterized protein n=1 Tax=Heliocybe sulcata TaxID=5364 RepID=A0A5C3MWU6_9AGAM|nr:hypothetical protein OE88DRAFT_363048 [Heliocybe sulcata]